MVKQVMKYTLMMRRDWYAPCLMSTCLDVLCWYSGLVDVSENVS